MKRRLVILGVLLLGTAFLATTGLLEPRAAFAFCDASQNSCDDNGGTGGGGSGGGGVCSINYCQTTCTGPMGVECCCYYSCPSGGTWVCKQGVYCSNTDRSCIFQTWP